MEEEKKQVNEAAADANDKANKEAGKQNFTNLGSGLYRADLIARFWLIFSWDWMKHNTRWWLGERNWLASICDFCALSHLSFFSFKRKSRCQCHSALLLKSCLFTFFLSYISPGAEAAAADG